MASLARPASQQPQHIVTSFPFVQAVSNEFQLDKFQEYSGIIKIRRLLWAAERCPTVSVDAFRMALRDLKSAQPTNQLVQSSHGSDTQKLGPNAQLYVDVVSRARELLLTPSSQPEHQFFLSAGAANQAASDPLFAFDQHFHAALTKNFNELQHHLENQLAVQRRDGEREQIKVAALNLAEFYFNRGDLNAALNRFLESKEFVNQTNTIATNMELLNIAINIIKCSVLMLNMTHVKTQAQRAQRLWKEITAANQQMAAASSASATAASASGSGVSEKEELADKIMNSKLNAAMGLFNLKSSNYHGAASNFVQVVAEMSDSFADVITCRDVATYGAICALASFTRKELKELVLGNTEFKKLLDSTVPTTWKIILQEFYHSNYAHVFELIEKLKPDLYLDLFLSQHVNRLIKHIRERAFIQYFKAYASVELCVMQVAFNLDIASLERTLAELIQDGKIAARIDSHKKILHARHSDQRNDTFQQALALGNRYTREMKTLLMRLSLVEHDMAVRSGDKKKSASARQMSAQEEELYRTQQAVEASLRTK